MEDPVPVDFEGFGEETYGTLCDCVYPVYRKVSMSVHDNFLTNDDVPKEAYEAALKALNEALVTERMRNLDSKRAELSDDPDVAELQKQIDAPRPMAEQAVKERRCRAVAEMPPSSEKIQ